MSLGPQNRAALLPARFAVWARASAMRRAGVLVSLILVYALGLLWPYEVEAPSLIKNGAVWTADQGLRFSTPGLAIAPQPADWQAAARATGRLRVVLRARSFRSDQLGPARLFTASRNTYAQNLVIGQSGTDLTVRLLSTCRGLRASGAGCRREIRVHDAFATSEWIDIELLIEPGRARLRAGAGSSVEAALPADPLRVWDVGQRVAVGNDVSGDRPWLGEIASAIVETTAGSNDQLRDASLEFPKTFWLVNREPKLVPFRDTGRRDIIVNVFLYVPLATLLTFLLDGSGRQIAWRVAFIVLAMSVTLECLQIFFRSRNPSVTDAILNLFGGISAIFLLSARQEIRRYAGFVRRYFRGLLGQGG